MNRQEAKQEQKQYLNRKAAKIAKTRIWIPDFSACSATLRLNVLG
jgi:hypothetical protein